MSIERLHIMSVGIKVTNNIYIGLWEIKEQLLRDLDESKLLYNIAYDKVAKSSDYKETIIQIPDLEVEISLNNDIIKYIRSGANKYTILDEIETGDNDTIKHIRIIKEEMEKRFGDEYNIRVERISADTLGMTFVLSSTITDEKVRVQILKNNSNEVYMNTMLAL